MKTLLGALCKRFHVHGRVKDRKTWSIPDTLQKKIMHKKNFAIIYLCSDDNYAFAVATSIMSVEETNPGFVDNYIIFCDKNDLTQETRTLLLKISDKIIFRDFIRQDIENILKLDAKTEERFSYLLYAKVYCIDYLKKYKNVCFLGGDVLVVSDISELLNYGPLAWRRCARSLNECTHIDTNDIYTNPNGDFIFMTDTLEKFTSNDLISILNNNVFKGAFPDEFCYGMFAFSHKIKTDILDYYHRLLNNGNLEKAKTIHAHMHKFWKYNVIDLLLPEFNKYYTKWLALGGKGYEGPHKGPAGFPKERHKVIPYLYTMEVFARFNDALYQQLPSSIRPSLATYQKTLPFFIIGKNRKECSYYVYFKYARIMHIGFRCTCKSTDTIRQLFDTLHTFMNDFTVIENEKGQLFIYREYQGNIKDYIISNESLQEIAADFVNFIERTLPVIMASPLWRDESYLLNMATSSQKLDGQSNFSGTLLQPVRLSIGQTEDRNAGSPAVEISITVNTKENSF